MVLGQPCEPHWSGAFGADTIIFAVNGSAQFDDGAGSRLFMTGSFSNVGGLLPDACVSWDGQVFRNEGAGDGLSTTGRDLEVHNDGTGTALYLVAGSRVLGRTGANWTEVGIAGLGSLSALQSFADGSGPALVVAGNFVTMYNVNVQGIARYQNGQWSAMGAFNPCTDLAMVSETGGSVLYGASGTVVRRWDGASWNSTGYPGTLLRDIEGATLASGPRLFAVSSGTNPIIWAYDGTTWSTIPFSITPSTGQINSLRVAEIGGAPRLYTMGIFTDLSGSGGGIAAWSGASWAGLGSGLTGTGRHAALFDDGQGTALYVQGDFTRAGDETTTSFARWDGVRWASANHGLANITGTVPFGLAASSYNDGRGDAVYFGGTFTIAGSAAVSNLARWDGPTWESVGGGTNNSVQALEQYDDGGGAALFVGGKFTTAGGATTGPLARWRGGTWTGIPLPPTPTGVVDMQVSAVSGAPLLYITCQHTSPTRTTVSTWDGSALLQVGGDFKQTTPSPEVRLRSGVVGGSLQLFAGGSYSSVGGVTHWGLTRLAGGGWIALPQPNPTGKPVDMEVFAGELWVRLSPGTPDFVRWNGATWVPAPAGSPSPNLLRAFDDGTGPALYTFGFFGPDPTAFRWSGSTWTRLATKFTRVSPQVDPLVRAIEPIEAGPLRGMYYLGCFQALDQVRASGIIAWEGCATPCYPDCNADGALNLSDFGCFTTKFALADPYADCNGDGLRNLSDFGCFQTKFALGCP